MYRVPSGRLLTFQTIGISSLFSPLSNVEFCFEIVESWHRFATYTKYNYEMQFSENQQHVKK